MERIRLDIIPKGLMPVCHASQYDAGRVIRLDLMDGLQGYSLTDEEIELNVRKPDGHIVTASVDVVEGQTYVDIVTTEQMCAVEGENICELKISKDNAEIYSLNFKMMVEKSVTEGGDPSESFIYNLRTQIAEGVAEEVATQYDSSNVIFDTEPMENHGIGYTVTSEGIKTAIDNAFDYDNTASGSLVHIEDGADNIPVKSLSSQIVAVESGSGTKSPTNPYTISGFDSGIVTRCGKNRLNNPDRTTIQGSYVINNVNVPMVSGQYVLSFDFSGTSDSSSLRIDDENGSRIWGITKTIIVGHNEFLINLPSKGSFVKLFSNAVGTYTNFQIEQGDTSTPYEAYKGNTYTFNFGQTIFGGHFNNKGGEIADYGFIEFDGSSDENWQTYPSYNGFYIAINGMNIGTRQFGMCNEFTTTYDSSHTTNSCWFGVNSNRLFLIECSDTTGATVEDLKTWLASNPLKVFYPLATPRATTEGEGNLVVTHDIVDMGLLNWNYSSQNNWFQVAKPSGAKLVNDMDMLCSCYINNGTSASLDISIFQATSYIRVKDSNYTDADVFKTAVNGQKLVYELATPIILAITSQDIPTLLGENNIFSNCGNVEVNYYTNKAKDILEFVDSEIGKKNGTNIPIEANSQDSIKDYIDNEVSSINLESLPDTDITNASEGQVLTFDGNKWTNSNIVLPNIKYEEINVTFDASGEGTLFNSVKFVVGLKDIPSDQLYVGYVSYIAGSTIKIKALSRTAIAFSSQNNVSSTRKVGVYYLDNIATP